MAHTTAIFDPSLALPSKSLLLTFLLTRMFQSKLLKEDVWNAQTAFSILQMRICRQRKSALDAGSLVSLFQNSREGLLLANTSNYSGPCFVWSLSTVSGIQVSIIAIVCE